MSKAQVAIPILIIAVIGVVVFQFIAKTNEGTWVCEYGQWVRQGQPTDPKPNQPCDPMNANVYTSAPKNINLPPATCELITSEKKCRQRDDCLAVDFSDCTTEREQASKCHSVDSGCLSKGMEGFIRCETLRCPTVNANAQAAAEKKCLDQGGVWETVGRNPDKQCNLPAKDAGKECASGVDCVAGVCLAPSGDQALAENTGVIGRCPEWKIVGGCLKIVEAGIVNLVCRD